MALDEESLFRSIEKLMPDYTQLLIKALKDGLSAVEMAKESGGYIGTYYNFPVLSYRKNGLPNLSSSIGEGPIDYRKCFSSFGRKPNIDEKEIASFGDLVQFVRAHPKLHKRFLVETNPGSEGAIKIELDEILITSGIKDSIERYIHKFNTFEYEEKKGIEAITPTLGYVFNEKLDIDIYVPILFLDFPFDEYEIADDVYLERINEKHHLARSTVESYNSSAHKTVKASATHALVLKGWYVPNNEHMWYFNILSKPRAYPLQIIDKFFGALRVVSDVKTGYAQIYSVAKGWAADCKVDLPYVQGATVRSYPGWFEDYYWNLDVLPSVSEEIISQVRVFYNNIISAKENSIHLSLKRLNQCLVRDNEEDSVLDATIALEALLSDNGNQEMTHKLAMRVGALTKIEKSFGKSPQQAFRDIKNIYDYRSAIVHGSKSLNKKRIIRIDEENTVSAHVLAVDYLKMVLKVLLKNPMYREPKMIDNDLLLNNKALD